MNDMSLDNKKPVRKKVSIKKILLASTVFILFVLFCFGGYTLWQTKLSENTGVCSKNILEDAGKKIEDNKTNQLVGTIKEVQSLPGHETDSNCLYVLTKYYIDVTDSDNAQKYYNLLEKSYSAEVGYNSALGKKTLTPNQLKSQIEFVKKITDDAPSALLENQVQP